MRRLLGIALVLSLSGCASLGDAGSLEYRQKLEAQRNRAAAAIDDEEDEAAEPWTSERRIEQGNRSLASGDRARALWHYVQAHRLDPSHPEPLVRLGHFYLGDYPDQSAALFARAVELAPDYAAAQLGLGLARFAQGRLEEARASLERAVALAPELSSAHDALGVVDALQDDAAGSRERASRARELDPKNARIANNQGVRLLADEEWLEAEQAFRAAILLDPSQRAYHNNLGLALGRQGRYEEARQAFAHFATEQEVHNNLGYVYYLNGETAKAVEHYEQALRFPGGDRRTIFENLRTAAGPARVDR